MSDVKPQKRPVAGPGLLANRYQILATVGRGGMGIVYRALDRLRGQHVALKRISTSLGGTEQDWQGTAPNLEVELKMLRSATQRQLEDATSQAAGRIAPIQPPLDSVALRTALAEEFRTLASLRHPHIIAVLDYGFDKEQIPFFTMELLNDARPLLAAGKGLSLEARVLLLVQVSQALAYLHHRGVVHRDLKSANILCVPGPSGATIKVLDFGLAVVKSRGALRLNDIAGTLTHMAPEILTGGPPSEAADLYALGVTAYELLAGRPLFSAKSSRELLGTVLHGTPDVSGLPVPEAFRDLLRHLLAKNPEERPQSTALLPAQIATAFGLSPPTEASSIRESYLQFASFVERQEEIELLMGALNDAASNQGSGWLIGGESGVGKSRLLEEIRTQALVHGAQVVLGEGSRTSGAPYHAFRDILRTLCLQVGFSDAQASALLPLLPDLPVLLQRPVDAPPVMDARSAQERLLRTIEEVFDRVTTPTVVLIEDLQWAGVEIIVALGRLMRICRRRPIVIIATYRNDEAPWLSSALPAMEAIKLQRFHRGSIAALSEAMLGPPGRDDELIDFLERETEGNAFFMVEVLRSLAAEDGMMSEVTRSRLPSKVLAGGIRAVIERRLSRVPPEMRPLLNLAAVAGRQLDLELIRSQEPRLDRWLSTCANLAVLEAVEQGWRFTHDKLRERLLEDLQVEQVRELHRMVAELIEASPNADQVDPSRLAYHYREAGIAAKAIHYASMAGERAMQEGAIEKALSCFQSCLTWHHDTTTQSLPIIRAQRLSGMALLALGRLPECTASFREAWRMLGLSVPEIDHELVAAEVVEAEQQIDELLLASFPRTDADPQQILLQDEALLLADSSLPPLIWLGQIRGAHYVCALGIKLCEVLGAREQRAVFDHKMRYLLSVLGMPERAEQHRRRAAQLHPAPRSAEVVGLRVTGVLHLVSCRWEEARRALEASVILAEVDGDSMSGLLGTLQLLFSNYYQANYQRVLVDADAFIVRAVKAGNSRYQAWGHLTKALVCWRLQLVDQALLGFDRAQRLLEKSHDPLCATLLSGSLALLSAQTGERERAHLLARQVLDAGRDQAMANHEAFAGYASATEALLSIDLTEPDQQLLPDDQIEPALALLKQAAKLFVVGRPSVLLYQAMAAQRSAKPGCARALFRLARLRASQLSMPYERELAQQAASAAHSWPLRVRTLDPD